MIQKQLSKQLVHVQDIAKSSKEDIDNFDLLLLGIPTIVLRRSTMWLGWFLPRARSYWFLQLSLLLSLVVVTKKIAQEYFCDAMGTIRDIVEAKAVLS